MAGAGAFGLALALTQLRAGRVVEVFGRNIDGLRNTRRSARLPDVDLPADLKLTSKLQVTPEDILLLAVPMQSLSGFLDARSLRPWAALACCKGIDLATGLGPTEILAARMGEPVGVLTGPSFAKDIAMGLPTALTLATRDPIGPELQETLSNETLRLYLSDDPVGAELGGALKNVVAIGCGLTMGAGLGESARAALMTRGYAEMQRLALHLGARPETLSGLSGFGDLALTCTSTQSRNFQFGLALGSGRPVPEATTEGRATAQAAVALAKRHNIDMPIAQAVAHVVSDTWSVTEALDNFLNRPLKRE